MVGWTTTWGSIVSTTKNFFRRHWQRALLIRERLRFSEEVFHLLLAGGVGIIGGLTNLFFWGCTNLIPILPLRRMGDLLSIAPTPPPRQRAFLPGLGRPAAGGVPFLGVRPV